MDSGDGGESWRFDRDADGERDGERDGTDEGRDGTDGGLRARVRWFMRTDEEWVLFVREVLSSLAVVVLIGLLLFAASGIWPPMVAVESGSMTPHLQKGDLVFVMEEHRFADGAAHGDTGVVPYEAGAAAGYREFHEPGDVIVYRPYGDTRATPIIHRARFWVNEDENWYGKADPAYVGSADDCGELANCPAPHAGFVTKGDANTAYDQVDLGPEGPISSPIEPSWVVGTAKFRIPWLGKIRLLFGSVSADATALAGNTTAPTASVAPAPTAPTAAPATTMVSPSAVARPASAVEGPPGGSGMAASVAG